MKKINVNLIRGHKRNYINSIDKYTFSLLNEIKEKLKIKEYSYKGMQFSPSRLIKQYILLPIKLFFNYEKGEINYFIDPSFGINLLFCPGKKIIICYDLNINKEGSFFQKIGYTLTKINWRFMNKADKIITISKYSKQELINKLKINPKKIEIIYPAINHSKYKNKRVRKAEILKKYNLPNKKIILYVGTEQNRKNVDKIIQAMNLLKKTKNNAIFLKIGVHQNIKNRKKNIELIKEYNLQNSVFIKENVPEQDLIIFYNIAEIFIFPSIFEGFGMPPLEAMACGCPVITTHKTSLKEVVDDSALILDNITPQEIANKINYLFQNNKLKRKLIKKGYTQSKKFSWKKEADRLYEILNKI